MGNFQNINPLIKILFLTRIEASGYLKTLLEAEANDYVLKQSASGDLIQIIYRKDHLSHISIYFRVSETLR